MSELLLPPDRVPAVITPQQTRDFAYRVLYGVANRISGGDDVWFTACLEWRMDRGDFKTRVGFGATYDRDTKTFYYDIDFATIYPFDDTWDPRVVNRMLHMPLSSLDNDEENEARSYFIAGTDETPAMEEECPIGYLSVDYDYRFITAYGRGECMAHKTMSLGILDDEYEPIDEDVIYTPFAVHRKVYPADLEHHFSTGEVIPNIAQYETEMTAVTQYDLEFILASLKAAKLVRSTCKPLSSKVL